MDFLNLPKIDKEERIQRILHFHYRRLNKKFDKKKKENVINQE